jgi:hypothetical protein
MTEEASEEDRAAEWARSVGAPEVVVEEIRSATSGLAVTTKATLGATVVYATADYDDATDPYLRQVAEATRVTALSVLVVVVAASEARASVEVAPCR